MKPYNQPTNQQPSQRAGNRPGLSQIAYRIGDYASIRQRLLKQLPETVNVLAAQETSTVSLAKLTTRAQDDFAIALIDAWAMVADVLTFYQERIANEGYLLTATERRSVLELARSIGYELDPGVAATTHLSFTVEDAPNAPTEASVPMGTQVMSVPVKDELPQTFETVEDLIAHVEWNAILPRASRPQGVDQHTQQLYLTGTSTQLEKGSLLLLVDAADPTSAHVLLLTEVQTDTDTEQTQVQWKIALPPLEQKLQQPQVFTFRQSAHLFGYNAPDWTLIPDAIKLAALEKSGEPIRGGIFRSEDNARSWVSASVGMPNSDILCVIASGQLLLAGTPDKGLFRSVDNGVTWEAANEGITSQNVLALHVADKESVFNEAIFAGTPNGGIFRSKDRGKNWVAINTGTVKTERIGDREEWQPVNTSLPNTVVRSLLTYSGEKTTPFGSIESTGILVRYTQNNSKSSDELQIQDTVTALGQTRTIVDGLDENSFIIDSPFIVNDLPLETAFVARVLVRFLLQGLFPQTETVTISAGTITSNSAGVVSGQGTSFLQLQAAVDTIAARGDVSDVVVVSRTITVGGQTLEISQITSDSRLETTGIFTRNDLDSGTALELTRLEHIILVGTDEGIYQSTNQGKDWSLASGNTVSMAVYAFSQGPQRSQVFAGTDRGIFVSSANDPEWAQLGNENDAINQKKVFALAHYGDFMFAGTEQGLYRQRLSTGQWDTINTVQATGADLSSLEQLAVRSLATYQRGGIRYLVAATDQGIFLSNNSDGTPVTWQNVSTDLSTTNTTVATVDRTSNTLFLGTHFSSFSAPVEAATDVPTEATLQAVPTPKKQEWPDFMPQTSRDLDLDTLYPRVLPESWIVLYTDRHSQDPEQAIDPIASAHLVADVTALDRSNFGISGKITRAELATDITQPEDFGLRSTRVLIQNEPLAIALEPLTVQKQQGKIFADPIEGKTLFLNELIPFLQPEQAVIVSGQHMRGQLTDVGGVLRSQYQWANHNKNIRNTVINTLTSADNTLRFIGTNEGLYKWQGKAKPWKAIIALNYKVIHSVWQGREDHSLLLIGANQQTYRSTDAGETWQILADMPESILQAVVNNPVTSQAIASAITAISGTTLKLAAPLNLPVGTVITLNGQTRIITQVSEDKQTAVVNAVFAPSLDGDYSEGAVINSTRELSMLLFAATHQGLYRSLDEGQRWQLMTALEPSKTTALCQLKIAEESLLIVATEQGLYQSDNNGETWTEIADAPGHILQLLPVFDRSQLWVGTARGLYLFTFNNGSQGTWSAMMDLRGRQILSLSKSPSPVGIIAGTDQGLYKHTYRTSGGTSVRVWESIDAGLAPAAGRAFAVLSDALIVGTEQGVFSTPNSGKLADPLRWGRNNAGLENTQVLSLAASSSGTDIIAGTTAGAFLSTSAGRTWQPLSVGLTLPGEPNPLAVTTLLARTASNTPLRWYAGTASGLFSWQPGDPQWTSLRSGLVYTDILAIAEYSDYLLVGTRAGGLLQFHPDPSTGQQQWEPTTLNHTDVQSIAVWEKKQIFIFAGTLQHGLYRSEDSGVSWENITQIRSGRGRLSSEDVQVTWSPNASSGPFSSLLAAGDTINVRGQARRLVTTPVEQSNNQWSFRIDQPFAPDLVTDSAFTIETGLSNRNITDIAIAPKTKIEIAQESVSQSSRESSQSFPPSSPFILYVSTAGSGVFRSTDGGDRWQQIITNLDDLDIRCLMAESGQTLWAGTAQKGLFRSINRGELWAPANHHLTNTDIQAILRSADQGSLNSSSLMVGGIGILISDDQLTTTPIQKNDIVQVITSPLESQVSVVRDVEQTIDSSTVFEYQNWTLKDPLKQIQGTLRTPQQQPFPLLPANPNADLVSELALVQTPPADQKMPVLKLKMPLKYSYDPATVAVQANIAKASHGETIEEVLGSGDGNEPFQQFTLNKPPLTYLPAANASGSESTLNIRVEGILWEGVRSLYPLAPQDKSYITRIEDDGTTHIGFGDGLRGARLPSGQENITATYRSGLGLDGNLNPGQLNILKTRPQSITDVINPLAAIGAANPERLADARTKAPPTVRTLDRIVSLQDFEDFAQGFSGIGKAQATAIWNGATQLVHITIAGIEGAAIPPTSQLYQRLQQAIDLARDPIQQVRINSYDRQLFNVEARILVDPRYLPEQVLAAVGYKLKQAFMFDKRQFDRGVTSAEIIAAIQSIEGAVAVDLDALYRVGESRQLVDDLTVLTARYVSDDQTSDRKLVPAQLLLLNHLGIQLSLVLAL